MRVPRMLSSVCRMLSTVRPRARSRCMAPAVTWSLVWLESISDSSSWYLCTCMCHRGGWWWVLGAHCGPGPSQALYPPTLITLPCTPANGAWVGSGLGLVFHLQPGDNNRPCLRGLLWNLKKSSQHLDSYLAQDQLSTAISYRYVNNTTHFTDEQTGPKRHVLKTSVAGLGLEPGWSED